MIIFDCGANDGESTIPFAKEGHTVYAFEPTPRMCDILKEKTKDLSNYVIVPKAVSDFNGTATFNIAGVEDWGCSSLFDFTDNVVQLWNGRPLHTTERIEVPVITMEKFIDDNNISVVDYLHCDAQGSDLQVLKGFGKHLDLLKEGVVEASRAEETKMYKGIDNTVDSVKKFLLENGFQIVKVVSNDYANIEFNVHFKKP